MSLLLALLATSAMAEQPTKRLSDAERGEELWARHCAACHGPTNRGDGPATEALVVDVPDLRGKVKVDDATLKLVLRGNGGMPGFETSFDKADARRVLKHMLAVHEAKATKPSPKKKPAADPEAAPKKADPPAERDDDATDE